METPQLGIILLLLFGLIFTENAYSTTCNSLHEVDPSSWAGDQIKEFNVGLMDRNGNKLLHCLAIATKYLLADQLLVFIEGNAKCLIANKTLGSCHQLQSGQSSFCGLRVHSNTIEDCPVDLSNSSTIQHRVDNSIDFYRTWTDYVVGFGQGPKGNYWLGLRRIHCLTWPKPKSLRVYMRDWNNTEYWVDYTSFSVASEADKYRLSVSGFHRRQGNIGDSLSYHNGMQFSTFDSDNDLDGRNCARTYYGAWWYKTCHVSNPNGLYYTPPAALNTPVFANGINWYSNFRYYYSLMEFRMDIFM